jgi:hypothetical protein
LTSAANLSSPLIIKFQTCRVRLQIPVSPRPVKIKKNDHRALVIISSTGIAAASEGENGEQAVQNERVKSSDMKIDNGVRIIDDMHSCQLVVARRTSMYFCKSLFPAPVLSIHVSFKKKLHNTAVKKSRRIPQESCTYTHPISSPRGNRSIKSTRKPSEPHRPN